MDRRNLDCKQCGATLGQTTPTQLLIGDVLICKRVEMRCVKCDRTRVWYPNPNVDQPSRGNYVRA